MAPSLSGDPTVGRRKAGFVESGQEYGISLLVAGEYALADAYGRTGCHVHFLFLFLRTTDRPGDQLINSQAARANRPAGSQLTWQVGRLSLSATISAI